MAIGQHEEVARHAASYNRAAVFGLLGNFQYQVGGLQNRPWPYMIHDQDGHPCVISL